VKYGPIENVRYDDDGEVLGWDQPILMDGKRIGTISPETDIGRTRRIATAAEEASKRLQLPRSTRRIDRFRREPR
jgi:hypothetical protein